MSKRDLKWCIFSLLPLLPCWLLLWLAAVADGAGSGSRPRPAPRPTPRPTRRPTPGPTARPTTLAPSLSRHPTSEPSSPPTSAQAFSCATNIVAAPTASLLKSNYTSSEDAYDFETHGHATYECAETLVQAEQYEKAEYYLWCVLAHCETCDGSDSCQTSYVGLHERDECYSATWNYLGFVNRKKASPDFDHAETYYRTALDLWPGNCGAYAYLTELYLQTANASWAQRTYADLCGACGADHEHTTAIGDLADLACPTAEPSAANESDGAGELAAVGEFVLATAALLLALLL